MKVSGRDAGYTSPRIDRKWQPVAHGPAPYSTARRKLALLCTSIGDPDGEAYTPHSPKNLFPTAANQMSFDQRELSIIGHWPSTSRTPERYDRSVCASELLLRNTIIHQIVGRMGGDASLPPALTVTGHVRIGKPPDVEEPTQTPILPDESPVGPMSPNPTVAHSDSTSPTSRLESENGDTQKIEIPTQITSHTEPKTDVLALGSRALGNTQFLA